FHADNVSEVIKRFTTDPINVSKTLFTALDLISIQTSTRVRGQKVRRSRELTEIRRYDPENDEINVNDVFQWRPETDTYRHTAESSTLEEIQFDRGWSDEELERQLDQREAVLAYLIVNGLNSYAEVAATIQAYINDPSTILTLIANDTLETALEDLRQMESVLIDVDEEKEAMVPRPDPDEDTLEHARSVLERAEEELFADYRGQRAPDISEVLDVETDTVSTRPMPEETSDEDVTASAPAHSTDGATGPSDATVEHDDDEELNRTADTDRDTSGRNGGRYARAEEDSVDDRSDSEGAGE
ncbi:MAG: secretion system protein E, partial [Halanaeroarchaeum sp.]